MSPSLLFPHDLGTELPPQSGAAHDVAMTPIDEIDEADDGAKDDDDDDDDDECGAAC